MSWLSWAWLALSIGFIIVGAMVVKAGIRQLRGGHNG